jgi:hypothetical protein
MSQQQLDALRWHAVLEVGFITYSTEETAGFHPHPCPSLRRGDLSVWEERGVMKSVVESFNFTAAG